MRDIVAQFEEATPHRAIVSYGSTGKLYAQIRNGAPFALFLAADAERPERLEREGVAIADSRFTYAVGKLVLWSPDPNLIDPRGEVLRQKGVDRIALANPKSAPYGGAALEVLQRFNLWQSPEITFIQGDSISQTYQYISSGNVPLGFIALAQIALLPPGKSGSHWLIPEALYQPLRQQAVLLKRGEKSSAAQALYRWLQNSESRKVITRYGYGLTPSPSAPVHDRAASPAQPQQGDHDLRPEPF
ncbi:MAG: molybdate ABC transporter substrate-binding protein [Gammaproteobacteria bacterium]|nr:molybdate ABC transporter substrate-binding protein [Gammaproteobacteria bacterium]